MQINTDSQFLAGAFLAFILLMLLVRNIIKMNSNKEGLCVDPVKCGSGKLVDFVTGLPYDPLQSNQPSIEPSDKYLTSNMVISNQPANAEKYKINYFIDANRVYADVENDRLNKELLPRGVLFAI